ncbi:prepilin peptidase [Roseburia sp. 1XD42-69]|uniref:prepilin peptidase n=1 Tax=Roseburia sp. 1XD42-69 TaxID=2320088 RepID=UPI00210F808E|nr:prepilin peptidase [Roseburia sp. 1XD42-69]
MFFLLVIAVAQDIRSGRVSNKLILFGLFLGLLSKVQEYDFRGIYFFLRNISVPVILFYLMFLMHVLGAGDIKLFSMIGGILTIEELLFCIFYSFIAGGILSLFYLLMDNHRGEKLKYACNYLFYVCRYQKIIPYELPEEIPKSKMAFSLAVFLGWICMYAIPIVKSGGLFWYS